MRMQVVSEGGFAAVPGLARPILLDSDTLPPAVAEEMKRLVAAAHFFELPAQQPLVQRGADFRRYTITIADGELHHSIQVTEPVSDPALRELLAFALEHKPIP